MFYLIPLLLLTTPLTHEEEEDKIYRLQKEIQELRLNSLRKEEQADRVFRSDDEEFSQELEQSKKWEEEADKKEKELHELIHGKKEPAK